MADRIITVTDPSVVTNDTLAGYNNYSDIDGQLGTTMTPTEATNGHTVALSDGVVHEVTTKPVGTTNGEFSSVLSNSVEVDLSTPTEQWDISLATYDSISTDVSGQVSVNSICGICVNPTKTKLFIFSNSDETVFQYTINGDGTLTYDSVSLSTSGLTGSIHAGITMAASGRYLLLAVNSALIHVFDIAVEDIGTIENIPTTPSHSIASLNGDIVSSLALTSSDTKIFQGTPNGTLRRGTIDLAAGTISDDTNQKVLPSTTQYSFGLHNGSVKLYSTNAPNDEIRQYTLSIANDLSTIVDEANPLVLSAWDSVVMGQWTDGVKLFVVGGSTQTVRRYSM